MTTIISSRPEQEQVETYLGNHQASLNPSFKLGHHEIADSSTVKPLTNLGALFEATKLILVWVG